MSYSRRRRWSRRMALGLAFASVMFAGSASVVTAMIDPGTQSSDERAVKVIPYLSHGMLTPAEAGDDPYLTDIYVRPGESLGGPDGGPVATPSARETQGARAEADEQADDEPVDEPTQRVWTDRD